MSDAGLFQRLAGEARALPKRDAPAAKAFLSRLHAANLPPAWQEDVLSAAAEAGCFPVTQMRVHFASLPAADTADTPPKQRPFGTNAAEFLGRWVRDWQPDWWLNICAIPAAGGALVGHSWPASDVAGKRDEIARWIAEHNARGAGIYFTPNPLRHPIHGKPGKSDIAMPFVLGVDLDPPPAQPGQVWTARRALVLEAAQKLTQGGDVPALIADTGNGIGCFFRLPNPAETSIETAEAACAELTCALAETLGMKVDGTWNADRLMRLPFTWNHPSPKKLKAGYPEAPGKARVLAENPDARLTPERVAELAVQHAQQQQVANGTAQGAAGDDDAALLAAAWPGITRLKSPDGLPAALRARLADPDALPAGFRRRWEGDSEGLEDKSGSGVFMALMGAAKAANFSLTDAASLAWAWPDGDHLREQRGAKMQMRAVLRAWRRTRAEPDAAEAERVPPELASITAEGWAMLTSGASVILVQRDPATGEIRHMMRRADFLALHENRMMKRGDKVAPAGLAWLRHPQRPTFAGIGLYPPDTECPSGHLNLWTGWAIAPKGGAEHCPAILNHLRDVICLGDEARLGWLLRWMAHAVQRPSEKPGVAIVMQGAQGSGKGAVAAILRRIFGRHYFASANPEQITGHFNGHLDNKLIVFADEAFFAGDPRLRGRLKELITEPTTVLNRKGIDAIFVPSRVRLIMASNESHVAYVESDDRRFAVFKSGPKREPEYYTRLWAEIQGEGACAFLNMLLSLDLAGWNLREPPETEARTEQKAASLAGVDRWWFDLLTRGDAEDYDAPAGWFDGKPVLKTEIRRDYEADARKRGDRLLAVALFWKRLGELVSFTPFRPRQKGGGASDQRRVIFPSLADARARAAHKLGLEGWQWEE